MICMKEKKRRRKRNYRRAHYINLIKKNIFCIFIKYKIKMSNKKMLNFAEIFIKKIYFKFQKN